MTNFRLHDEQTVNGLRKIAYTYSTYIFTYSSSVFRVYVCYESAAYIYIYMYIFVLRRAFVFYFICTVSGCDGGNQTRIIAVHACRGAFSPLSYGRQLHIYVYTCFWFNIYTRKKENRANEKQQVLFVFCKHKKETGANFRLFAANRNKKLKFFVLGRQMIYGNQLLPFHQTCLPMCILYNSTDT